MAVSGFVRSIDQVDNVGNDIFRLTCQCALMNPGNSVFTLEFEAAKGSDWKIQCRTAFIQYALVNLGEQVDFVVLPGLDTL